MANAHIVEKPWFGLFGLACALAAILLWEIKPELGWAPLLVALLPCLLRFGLGRFSLPRIPYALPMGMFALTAGVGVWIAYQPGAAWNKFWLLAGAGLLFYALLAQPQENLWRVAAFLTLLGTAVVVYFLLTDNWQQFPVEVGFLNRIATGWMRVRPRIPLSPLSHNSVAGIINMTAPFLVPLAVRAWGEKRAAGLVWVLASALVFLFGLVLSISRGAVFAAGVSFGIGVVWIFFSRRRGPAARVLPMVQAGLILLLVAGMTGFLILLSGGLSGVENHTPGLPMGVARLDLAQSGIQLLRDYPFSGAGLNAFPALYSSYVLETPNFFVSHSYNLFVDIALEQGVIGLVAFGAVFLASLCSFAGQLWEGPRKWLVWAGLFGLLSVFFHGLSDDVVYNGWAAPFLFLMPATALLITRRDPEQAPSHPKRKIIYSGLLAAGMVLVVLLWFGRNVLLGSWYAELGAIQMDKIRLVDYASGQWDQGQNPEKYAPAENLFLRALEEDPHNRTANFRLGLIAMRTRDFSTAIPYLETAYQADPSYRGIWKALGFCYVWTGQYSRAFSLLAKIPETKAELDIYPWWWRAQGQEILGERAETMQRLLLSGGSSPDGQPQP